MNRLGILFCLLLIAACSGPRGSVDRNPDAQFGHRFEGQAPDGRRTLTLAAPPADGSFTLLPATFESVVIRPAPLTDESHEVQVEVLIKGSFPDACMEMHQFSQERSGNLIEATLDMRRPDDTVCMNVRRPYRLYLMLDGVYTAGSYVLKVNGTAVPFNIQPQV
ncbi:MAG: hypothetical protein OXM02_12150 [Bacteroidota bacterium]|nr:hypothetical protein [Bacteroidota bacterium]MDE2835253.1 hypothetical protein [Bacteroidota bacterium]